jgi:LPXTG-site transpeptidase (sortase) family protein
MRRTAPVLISALILGAGAGFFVHSGRADDTKAEAAPVSQAPMRQVPPLMAQPAVPPAVPAVAPKVRAAAPHLWIPRLDLKTRIFAPSQLDRGPAWWPVTGRPGGGDTIAVAGHRTTKTRPFYFLERLQPGDRIHVAYGGEKRVYRVSETRVVSASNLHIGDAVGYERLLLTACTPRGSAEFRLVVEALPA